MQVRVDPVYLDFCQNILLSSDDELVRTGLITLCDKQLASTRPPVTRLMNFRRTLSARDPDSGFYHEASDSFLAKNQTVNFLQIFPRQRGVKITVVLPDYTECLIYQ